MRTRLERAEEGGLSAVEEDSIEEYASFEQEIAVAGPGRREEHCYEWGLRLTAVKEETGVPSAAGEGQWESRGTAWSTEPGDPRC